MSQNTITLTPEQADEFGRELDAIKERVMADLGEKTPTTSVASSKPSARWKWAGAPCCSCPRRGCWVPEMLGIAKILDNMEIGHNIMHGQYDWMRNPAISGQSLSGTPHAPPISGGIRTTTCTTPTPTSWAWTATSATGSCG